MSIKITNDTNNGTTQLKWVEARAFLNAQGL